MTSEELKLLRSFPGSVVNSKGMFVPEPDDIAGFSLMEEWMGPEIKCRVLERLSWRRRSPCHTETGRRIGNCGSSTERELTRTSERNFPATI